MRPVAFVALALLAGCGGLPFATPLTVPSAQDATPPERIPLDPEVSPLAFRWLSDHAVLVSPETGSRTLASFGNYVGRYARPLPHARLSVWDDESAWQRWHEEQEQTPAEFLTHKRAEFLKDDSGPAPVEQFTVFDRGGSVLYERDFRDWPLTDTDP